MVRSAAFAVIAAAILVPAFTADARGAANPEAEELVAKLEGGETLKGEAFGVPVRDAEFNDAQRIRLTALLLKEGYEESELLISLFNGSKSFGVRLPPAAISNLITYIDRASGRDREEDRVGDLLVVAMNERRIDDAAFARVSRWLPHGVDAQRFAAIKILSAVSREDARLPAAAGMLASHLGNEPDDLATDMAINGVATLARHAPLQQQTRDTVLHVATTHRRGIIRVCAAEILIDQDAVRDPDTLAAGIEAAIGPHSPREDRSAYDPRTLNVRAIGVLTRLYPPPYPSHVNDALIGALPDSFELLRKARAAGVLTPPQFAALEQRAAEHMKESWRLAQADQIYDLVLSGVDLTDEAAGLVDDFTQNETPARYAAAFRLRAVARNHGVAPEVAAAARRVVLEEAAPAGLRRLAAEILIVRGANEDPVPILVTAIQASSESSTLEFLGPVFFESLKGREDARDVLIGYGADVTLQAEFRRWLLSQLSMQRLDGKPLSEEHERRLRALALEDPDRQVRWNAAQALRGFGVRRPVGSLLDSGELQTKFISYGLIALALAYVVIAIAGLFRFRRWALAGWILFSLWMIPCFGLALIAMMGHNRVPPWTQMLEGSWPLYISFAVYASWFIGSISWRRHGAQAA